ncbi:MAG: hypothetical protein LKE54_00170 [Prevotella sp.]|nr:hypothetical protein [Prevotella sp.]MCH3993483.1 hypothetical protein [Prevotella sp.]
MGTNNFHSSTEAKAQGRGTYYKMLQDARDGNLVKIRNGVYASPEQLAGTMIDLKLVVPDGILCSYSAWNVYGLTTSLPQAFHVALKRGRKISLPEFPPIELHFVSGNIFNLGAIEMEIDGYKIPIYDIERCVCDAIKHRNKIGIDVCAEILNNYLKRPERNLSRLMDYARQMRVTSTLEKYLEIRL